MSRLNDRPSEQETTQATQRWILDPARSTIEFRARGFWGLATVVGHFSRFDGSYTVGPDTQSVELIIDADSLDTGNRRRDQHLRSSAFFGVEPHPHIRFTATAVTNAGNDTLRVRGELEAAGTKVPLSLEAAVRELDGELEVEATTLIDHRLFGMTWSPLGMIRSPSTLHVKARLTSIPPERRAQRSSDHPSVVRSRSGKPAPQQTSTPTPGMRNAPDEATPGRRST
jgi:polyisoprenoid-binding protein YceI